MEASLLVKRSEELKEQFKSWMCDESLPPLLRFPDDLLVQIAFRVPNVACLFRVCKRMELLSYNEQLWKLKLMNEFSRNKPKEDIPVELKPFTWRETYRFAFATRHIPYYQLRRIEKELTMIRSNPIPNVTIAPKNDYDLLHWNATIIGPADTPYENGVFELEIELTKNYPMNPPKVVFKTRIYHPNVSMSNGAICLDILSNSWSPALTLKSVCLGIILLLQDPNYFDVMEPSISQLYHQNKELCLETTRQWTRDYASPK